MHRIHDGIWPETNQSGFMELIDLHHAQCPIHDQSGMDVYEKGVQVHHHL